MPKKIKDLNTNVTITQGFPGNYIWMSGMSYYLNGDTSIDTIHFSVPGQALEDFRTFHVTKSFDGSNVGIWFNGPNYSDPPNTKNLPASRLPDWTAWWKAQQENVKSAAAEFWTNVQA